MISKPIDQITTEDIAALCDHDGAYESLTLEFKRELPGRDDRTGYRFSDQREALANLVVHDLLDASGYHSAHQLTLVD